MSVDQPLDQPISEQQLSNWRRDGFLMLPGFVDRGRCERLRTHVDELLAGIDPDRDGDLTVFSTTEASHAQDEWFLGSGDTVRWFMEDGAVEDGRLTRPLHLAVNKLGHAMHDLDPVFDEFSRRPELAAAAKAIGFVEPLLLQSMYIFKQPDIGGEVVCHCDHSFLWTEPQSVTGMWFAIEDATIDNGCMWAIPGGHHLPARSRFRLDGNGTTTDIFDPTPYPSDQLVPLEAPAGALILLHGTLPHCSAPNRSRRSRHAYTLHLIEGRADYLADNWLQRSTDVPLRGF